jgi:hypothetical protein
LDHQRRQQGTTGQQTIENFCRRIRNNLQRRQRQRPNTLERPNHQPEQGENTWRTLQEKWKQKWESYRRTHVDGPPAAADLKAKEILKMRSQLPRRDTMATLVRSECIGLRAFLHKRRVPGFDNPACDLTVEEAPNSQAYNHVLHEVGQALRTTGRWCLRRGGSGQSLGG